MRERWLLIANVLLFFLTATVLSTLQSALWFQFFGSLPPPHMWIPLVTYLSLYRKPVEGVASLYLLSLIWMNLTVIPLGIFMLILLCLHLSIYLIKERIYWPGSTYFMLACGVSSLLLPIYQLIISYIFETKSITGADFIAWILQTLLTALFALPIYPILLWIDKMTHKEQPTETGTQVL